MNNTLFKALVLNEWRLRSRRLSSVVILLVVIALSWLMVLDPKTGYAMMVSAKQRMVYDSHTLAFGSTIIAIFLFGLFGFYLARGRSQEDLRSGTATVLAATPVGNRDLLLSRWVGSLGFLLALATALMLTIWVLQLVRGEGPLQPLPYLQMLVFGLLPGLVWCASLGVLSDAWAPLMGKRGDLLYFVLWMLQFAAMPATLTQAHPALSAWQVLDIGGVSPLLVRFVELTGRTSLSVGGGPFDPLLPLLQMPTDYWNAQLVALRLGAALLALLPLLPALALFHRYAPDKVKLRQQGARWRVVVLTERLLRPLTRGFRLLFTLGAHLPGWPGRVLADLGLILLSQPLLGLGLLAAVPVGALLPAQHLPVALGLSLLAWGLAVADAGSRDHQSGLAPLAGATPGGSAERVLRSLGAPWVLGLLVCAPVLLRWLPEAPLRVLAAVTGLLSCAAASALLGFWTRGSRSFLVLFLFALYLSLQVRDIPVLDLFGLNDAANAGSALTHLAGGLVLSLALGLSARRSGLRPA
ncbi:ABC-type glycerol-3-phosphate transport system permease component [Inhella inkyongensis]|uniref:ABC-type glycerol-3-phosphate transport system permease component n=1 Tax=Inhella inkyongensis TaxID=392593 RepID=A0A840S2C8_9BURK|nr:hypothetical protein [Inhella inkyongensis]MBB5203246.1 ABC-type glycerol-3-phosphate transport system permease component [Inhella inkyongensis]